MTSSTEPNVRDAVAVERATIPVENIRGPVQLVLGMDNEMWPSSDLADIAFHRLEAHHHPFAFHHLKYPGVGHMILVLYWPLTGAHVYTMQVEINAASATVQYIILQPHGAARPH
jgi:hypothetical protein